jgi:hypothetical protein
VHSRKAGVSEAARVKTQWEKALQSSARSYIQEVHQETLLQRGTVSSATAVEGGDGGEGGAAETGIPNGSTSSNSDRYSAYATAVSELNGTKRALSTKEERLELIKQRRLNSAAAAAFMQ